MTHFVVVYDYSVTGFSSFEVLVRDTNIVGITHTLEEAKVLLSEASADEKQYAQENNWDILVDTDVEFKAGEPGNHENEYAHYYIKVKEV
jgi:proteasome lid subunit RPN8/RPN11